MVGETDAELEGGGATVNRKLGPTSAEPGSSIKGAGNSKMEFVAQTMTPSWISGAIVALPPSDGTTASRAVNPPGTPEAPM